MSDDLRKRLIALREAADIESEDEDSDGNRSYSVNSDAVDALVLAAARMALEEAAKVCEAKVPRDPEYGGRFGGYGPWEDDKTGPECAAAIRTLAKGLE